MSVQSQIRQEITEKIIASLERGVMPWVRPWSSSPNAGLPTNLVSHRPYTGVNPLLLQLHAYQFGFASKWWATFDQISNLGGSVKKRPNDVQPGQWGCRIVFYKPLKVTVQDNDGADTEKQIPLLRTYTVFNVDQCDGIDQYKAISEPTAEVLPDYEVVEQLVIASGVQIQHGGNQAFYQRPVPDGSWPNHKSGDCIRVPPRKQFTDLNEFYSVILHELAHWAEVRTGWEHEAHGYAMGELVAEMTAAMLATELHLPQCENIANHASYLKHWLEAMKGDSSFIFKASTQASKVADYLLKFVPEAVAV